MKTCSVCGVLKGRAQFHNRHHECMACSRVVKSNARTQDVHQGVAEAERFSSHGKQASRRLPTHGAVKARSDVDAEALDALECALEGAEHADPATSQQRLGRGNQLPADVNGTANMRATSESTSMDVDGDAFADGYDQNAPSALVAKGAQCAPVAAHAPSLFDTLRGGKVAPSSELPHEHGSKASAAAIGGAHWQRHCCTSQRRKPSAQAAVDTAVSGAPRAEANAEASPEFADPLNFGNNTELPARRRRRKKRTSDMLLDDDLQAIDMDRKRPAHQHVKSEHAFKVCR